MPALTATQAVWVDEQRRDAEDGTLKPASAMAQDFVIREPYKLAMGLGITGNGTSGATSQTGRTTTTSGSGTGMTVALTAAGGVVTGIAIETLGNGLYQRGDTVTVSTAQAGTGANVTFVLG